MYLDVLGIISVPKSWNEAIKISSSHCQHLLLHQMGFSELCRSGCPQKSRESSSCLALACTHSGSGNKTALYLKDSSWRVDWSIPNASLQVWSWCEIVALSPKSGAREGQCSRFVGEEVAFSCGITRVLSAVSVVRFLSCPKITSEEN